MIANRAVALMLAAVGVQSATPVEIPAETAVIVELAMPVASNTPANGDFLALRVAADVTLDGRILLPAGTTGVGQVVHAATAGGLGRPGELIIAARRIDCGGTVVPLRGLRLIARGTGNEGAAVVASTIPFAGFLVAGHNRVMPAGQQGRAVVATATPVVPGCGLTTEGG